MGRAASQAAGLEPALPRAWVILMLMEAVEPSSLSVLEPPTRSRTEPPENQAVSTWGQAEAHACSSGWFIQIRRLDWERQA